MGGFAWVTLATNDSYSLGALVLAHSLRQVNTAHQLAVLITPAVSEAMRGQLGSIFDVVKIVDVLDSKDDANLALLKRPELGITFTKLHCWQLTQFEKGVFLDADTLVVRNSDELFEREEFSAAPDVGWPDCFNSGVFVFRPSVETFNNLIQFAVEKGSFDGGDQGLLNHFFNTWATDDIRKHLPFVYNLTSVAVYSYIPAFKQYGSESRIVHFIGPVKPWLQAVDPATRTVTPTADSAHLQPLLQQWWDIFIDKVHPGLSADLECASGMLSFFAQPTCSQDPLDCTHARSDPFPPPPPPPEPQAPDFPDPYTLYIEKDDERQYNLPYQPFQVVSSEGELLNITFADFVRESEPQETIQEDQPLPEPEKPQEDLEPPEPVIEDHQEHQEHHEPETVIEDRQFDFHHFVPDETVISAYLEHNVQEYQPFDSNPSEQAFEPLPRFLTIPEDDSRQSQKPYEPESSWFQPQDVWVEPHHVHDRAPSPVPQTWHEPPAITKSQSMSNLVVDATNASSFQNLTPWKSQPDVAANPVEIPKKLPGLKPLLPKIKSPVKSLGSPKYTEFTEVNMNLDYSDPFAPPVDNVGFVERAIISMGKKLELPQQPTPPLQTYTQPFVFQSIPEMNQYVDLSECKRQAGNVEDSQPISGLKTFTPKISPRRMKRSTRRSSEKWKPPETTSSMYDVDDIIKRLSEFSIGYTPPKAPETIPVEQTETRADRLFRGSALEARSKAAARQNGVPSDSELVKKKHFGPLAYSSPFAAPDGESLSETDKSVPEIVICVASPENGTNSLHKSYGAVTSRIEAEEDMFLTPVGDKKQMNGTTSSSEESFLSAVSSPSTKSDLREITEKMGDMVIEDDDPIRAVAENLGISGVKDWEEILEVNLTLPVAEGVKFEEKESVSCDRDWKVLGSKFTSDNQVVSEVSEKSLQISLPDDSENVSSVNDLEEIFESAIETPVESVSTVTEETLKSERIDQTEISESSKSGELSVDEVCKACLELTRSFETAEQSFSSALVDPENVSEETERLEKTLSNKGGEVFEDEVSPKILDTTFTLTTTDFPVSPNSSLPKIPEEVEPSPIADFDTSDINFPVASTEIAEVTDDNSETSFLGALTEIPEVADEKPEIDFPEASTETCSVTDDKSQASFPAASTEIQGLTDGKLETGVPEASTEICRATDDKLDTGSPGASSERLDVTVENSESGFPTPGTEIAETLPPLTISEEIFSNLATSTPTSVADPFNATYAAAVKKSPPLPSKPAEPVRTEINPQVQSRPVKQNGLKRPRKPKKPTPLTPEVKAQPPPSPPVKYNNKRKMEKPEVEFPANRFELLPEETLKLTHPQKKPKKSKKFSMPSIPSSLPSSSSAQIGDVEEEAAPHLPEPDDNPGIAGAIAQLNLEPTPGTPDPRSSAAQAEYLRRQSWETGKVDYMGRDSFANVWSKISETLSQSPIAENPSSPTASSAPQN